MLLKAAALTTLFSPFVTAVGLSPRVQTTTGGTIIGHEASNKTSVTEFLGIRFAEAPIGDLRFAAPRKFAASNGSVFEASEWVCQPLRV